MEWTIERAGTFDLIRITDDIGLNSDISQLLTIIQEKLEQGDKGFAFLFSPASFLYTRHIAVLIRCLELIKEKGGALVMVQPNDDIGEVLSLIDPDNLIRRVDTLEDLQKMKML